MLNFRLFVLGESPVVLLDDRVEEVGEDGVGLRVRSVHPHARVRVLDA